MAIIAEIKPQSPTLQRLSLSLEALVDRAQHYEQAGVVAISVLTDQVYFGGSFELLKHIKQRVSIPVLCKDFIIHELQVKKAVQAGADAILLIVALLKPARLRALTHLCLQVGIEPVVEIQNEYEYAQAREAGARLIAVNSRDLRTLKVDTERALSVVKAICGSQPILFFSGIHNRQGLLAAKKAGAVGVLVGTVLMTAADPVQVIQKLKGNNERN